MTPELMATKDQKLSGSQLKAAMDAEQVSMRDAAAIFDVSLKTMYNLVRSEELRGRDRWAVYAVFPSLRPTFVSPEAE